MLEEEKSRSNKQHRCSQNSKNANPEPEVYFTEIKCMTNVEDNEEVCGKFHDYLHLTQ